MKNLKRREELTEEIIYINCFNQACQRPVPFVKGSFALPEKTYCDFCCGGMTSPPNSVAIDKRSLPKLYGRKS